MSEPKKKILYVEDHEGLCELIGWVLEDYQVSCAGTLADALKRTEAEHFDLYLLDYNLPDGTGAELCLLIRVFDQETPILFCTGNPDFTEARTRAVGAQGLIRKGRNYIEEILGAISQVLAS
ncbi:MAG TPA: response regulator [Blastocatellia bacterium]|nr:response regulator [Blastocatellia bacterium]